jgi:hypothetical protein
LDEASEIFSSHANPSVAATAHVPPDKHVRLKAADLLIILLVKAVLEDMFTLTMKLALTSEKKRMNDVELFSNLDDDTQAHSFIRISVEQSTEAALVIQDVAGISYMGNGK